MKLGKTKQRTMRVSIRIPYEIWRKLKMMVADEKIKSIHAAVIKGLTELTKNNE